MERAVLMVLAMVAFAVPAYFATRQKLASGAKGETSYVSSYAALFDANMEAAQSYIHRLLLRMGWAWVLLCAPLLSYLPGSRFDFKRYAVILLGCILLGLILSAVTHQKRKDFKSVEVTAEDQLDYYLGSTYGIERKMEEAKQGVKKINAALLRLILFEALILLLFQLLAAWASGFTTTWYVVFLVVFFLLVLFMYLMIVFWFAL